MKNMKLFALSLVLAASTAGVSGIAVAQQDTNPSAPAQNAAQLNSEAQQNSDNAQATKDKAKAAKKAAKADKKAAKHEKKNEANQQKAADANAAASQPQ